jgi:homoaconitate hydratase
MCRLSDCPNRRCVRFLASAHNKTLLIFISVFYSAIWATGQTWWQVPEMVKVELKGQLPPGVTGKDVIVALCGSFNNDQVLNSAIEFVGDGVTTLSIDERLTIANMTTEWGALAGVFPVDDRLLRWYDERLSKLDTTRAIGSSPSPSSAHPRLNRKRLNDLIDNPLAADTQAHYSKHLTLDLSSLVPHISGPNSVKVSTPLPELAQRGIPIQKAYLVSCTNSRASDLKAAADVVRGRTVSPGVEFYVAAASSVVQKEAEASGDWGALVSAGAKVLPAGCGPCIGLGTGLLEDGEVGISATNRNFKGRMGSPKAQAYLASPAIVAASAIAGRICGPDSLDLNALPSVSAPSTSIQLFPSATAAEETSSPAASGGILPTFPPTFSGPLLFVPQDNLNTDGIYPGKYTYQDDVTPQQQAEVVMQNYDPSFASALTAIRGGPSLEPSSPVSHTGAVLATGYNFGTGSSREQAATALRFSGVPIVIAGSFGDIFKRNAINNSLICVECPELIAELTERFGKDAKRGSGGKKGELTVHTGWHVVVGSEDGRIEVTLRKEDGGEKKVYRTSPIGRSVQEVATAGGLEKWVQSRL